MTTRCHSVFSLRLPDCLSRQLSEVATERFTTGSPELRRRTSGSLPRLPTRMTLLTLPAMTASVSYAHKPDRLRSPRTPFTGPNAAPSFYGWRTGRNYVLIMFSRIEPACKVKGERATPGGRGA